MVITVAAGIKNPSEAGSHSVWVDVLGPGDNLAGASSIAGMIKAAADAEPDDLGPKKADNEEPGLKTVAKIKTVLPWTRARPELRNRLRLKNASRPACSAQAKPQALGSHELPAGC